MKKVIVLSALLLVTGMSVYAQEDFSKSIKTTTTIVENADKYKGIPIEKYLNEITKNM